MHIRRLLLLTGGVFLSASGLAAAQGAGKTGVTVAYPGSIGLIWHATDAVAFRPDFSFSHNSTEGSSSDSDGTAFGVDISALFYVKKYDNVRTYVSPRFSYTRASTTSTTTSTLPTTIVPSEITNTTNTTGGAGLFGVQYSPSPHFSIFGEVGVAYTHRHSDTTITSVSSSKGNTWGTTAGIGIVFYP